MDTQLQIKHDILSYRFIKFCAVGVVNTALDLLIYFVLTRHLGFNGELIYVAKAASFIIATLNSFLLNRIWTFERKDNFQWAELFKFYATAGSGIFINLGIHFINVQLLGVNDIASSLIAALFTAVWGFTMVRYFVFK
jgi:putative flippase GtrA